MNRATEIDPTQKVARPAGRSPVAILVSTFSDELAISAGGKLTGRRIDRPIQTVEVASTLSAIVGAKPPSGAREGPLPEVMTGSEK